MRFLKFGALVLSLCTGSPLLASVISINFVDNPPTELTAGQTAGVIPATNWNNWTDPGNTTTGTRTGLVNDAGTSVNGSISIFKSTGDISNGASGASTATANGRMINEGFGGGGISNAPSDGLYFRVSLPTSFAQNGLNLYVYSWSNLLPVGSGAPRYAGIYQYGIDTVSDGTLGPGSFTVNSTIGETFVQNYDDPVSNFSGTFFNNQASTAGAAGRSNYALLNIPASALADDGNGMMSFDFRVGNILTSGTNFPNREWLNGMQIEAIPEPSLLWFAGIVGGGVLYWQRKRVS